MTELLPNTGTPGEHIMPARRIAVVTNILSHYRVPCFAELARRMPGRITFFMLADKMAHRGYVMANTAGDLPVMCLRGWGLSHPPYDDRHINDIRPILRGGYDTIILGAWDEPTYLMLWAWGAATGKRVLFWIESTAYDGVRSTGRERYKRTLIKRSAACLVPGKRAFEYCKELGMPATRIFVAPNAVDRDYFRGRAERLLPERAALRARLRLAGTVVLFVGRLVEGYKHVMTLIKAASSMPGDAPVTVIIAGDGPDRPGYEAWIAANNCGNIRFVGELDHDRLCEYYAAADVMVLPSKSETWGFVLNEAMEFGLPIITSDAVGAGPDLVHHGQNGFVIPVGDHHRLAQAIIDLHRSAPLRSRMGQASKEIIKRFSPENWAAGVCGAIGAVGAMPRRWAG